LDPIPRIHSFKREGNFTAVPIRSQYRPRKNSLSS